MIFQKLFKVLLLSSAVFSVTCFGMEQKEQQRVLNPTELHAKIRAATEPLFDEFHASTRSYDAALMKGILIYEPGQKKPFLPANKMKEFEEASQKSLDFTTRKSNELDKKRLEIMSQIIRQNAEAFEQSKSK